MNIEPVRYSRLIMQLIRPTPMKALRHARSASASSERRTAGAAAIKTDLCKTEELRDHHVVQTFAIIVHFKSRQSEHGSRPIFVIAQTVDGIIRVNRPRNPG